MKIFPWIILIVIAAALLLVPLLGKAKASPIEVRQITPEDGEILEEWIRVTAEKDVLGVNATRSAGKWNWTIFISAAEFVRGDPLAARLDRDITAALSQVKGVTAVAREDTEVWLVQGQGAAGADLVRACGEALDRLAPEIRDHLKKLH